MSTARKPGNTAGDTPPSLATSPTISPTASANSSSVAGTPPNNGRRPLANKLCRKTAGGFGTQPTGGIWQTVWLEAVPEQSIRALRLTPDIDAETLNIIVSGENLGGCTIRVVARDGNRQIAGVSGRTDRAIHLGIPNAKYWQPDHPFLYGLRVEVLRHGAIIDAIDSYFGMRKISVGEDENGIKRFPPQRPSHLSIPARSTKAIGPTAF